MRIMFNVEEYQMLVAQSVYENLTLTELNEKYDLVRVHVNSVHTVSGLKNKPKWQLEELGEELSECCGSPRWHEDMDFCSECRNRTTFYRSEE